MNFTYTFPAVRGIQAEKEYYITMIPLKYLVKILPEPGEFLPPEYRAQRRINEQRIPGMKSYILDNRDSYIFSSLTASIDGNYSFEEVSNTNIGLLHVNMEARILINDGQHRRAAIAQALLEDDSLADETISVVLYEDRGLKQSQQMFSDLNMNAQKSSNSINTCYETRNALAVATKEIVRENTFLNKYTDLEKDNLGINSSTLFTLYSIYRVNKKIVGKENIDDRDKLFLKEYWDLLVNHIPQWRELQNREITKRDLRENYVVTLGITLLAIGRVGNWIYVNQFDERDKYLAKLVDVDWSRKNPMWKERMIRNNGKIINNENAIILSANYIKSVLGIELSLEETKREESLR